MIMKPDAINEAMPVAATANARAERAMRQAATEFESLFLTQLTSALHSSSSEDEDNLFGSDATNMYRQMFAEQLAKTMAEGGGVGLAEIILRQMQASRSGKHSVAPVIERVKDAMRSLSSAEAGKSLANPARTLSLNSLTARKSVAAQAEEVEWQLPIAGPVTSEFGARRDPINGRQRMHRGVDIAAPRGTPIESAAAGRVVFAGQQRGYGNTVVIAHADGRQTRYAHADELQVSTGEDVVAGQIIATVGTTGRATGPHLHFEVIEEGQRIDPVEFLAKDFMPGRR